MDAAVGTVTTLAVRVTPRARRNAVVCDPTGTIKVYVTAPPEDGRATGAALETLAEWLGLKRRQVSLRQGLTSRNKVVAIEGITGAHLQRIIHEKRS